MSSFPCESCEYLMTCRITDPDYCHSWTPTDEWIKKQGEKEASELKDELAENPLT